VKISAREGFDAADELERIWRDGSVTVGGWHTHPRPQRLPSTTDRESALQGIEWNIRERGFGAPRTWVDLILTADPREGWAAPDVNVHGWVTYRNDASIPVTEPVKVVGK
jgi:hypothetical protein